MRSLGAMTWQLTANPTVSAMPKKIRVEVSLPGRLRRRENGGGLPADTVVPLGPEPVFESGAGARA
jgi:hypothetical protein